MVIERDKYRRTVAGFTLLELLVVLAIAGLLVSIVPPVVSAVVPGVKLKVAARELAVTLRDTRNRAITRNAALDVTFEFEPPRYIAASGDPHLLPSGVQMTILDGDARSSEQPIASLDIGPDEKYSLRFYPDGSSSGATVRIGKRDTHYLVDVGWLMGRVSVSEARADAQ